MCDYKTPTKCEKCGSKKLKTRRLEYPVPRAKRLLGHELTAGRVWVKVCEGCGHMKPTEAGMEKVVRCMDAVLMRPIFELENATMHHGSP
jgi:hypothetical protein